MDGATTPIHLGQQVPYTGAGDGAGELSPEDPAGSEAGSPRGGLYRLGALEAVPVTAPRVGVGGVQPEVARLRSYGIRPWGRTALLVASDAGALALAYAAAELSWGAFAGGASPLLPSIALGAALLCMVAYAAGGLYAAFPLTPVEEVQAGARSATAAFGALLVAVLALPGSDPVPVAAGLPLVWLLVVVLTPLLRASVRAACAGRPWWGCPVVVLGAGAAPRRVVQTLQLQPELGLRPVAVLHDDPAERARVADLTGVAAPGQLALAPRLAAQGAPYAVLAFSSTEDHRLAGFIERHGRLFRRLLVVPDLDGVASLWVGVRDVGGVIGFEVEHRLLVPWRRALKRSLDVLVAVAGLLVLAPFLLVVAMLIRLDSAGPVFYVQDRLGRGGRCFRLLKFRTMHVGAHDRLRELLERDPEARAQYEHFAKLPDDPRVTRVGRFLRKYSLDEFPQLLNVLRGDMSLVGPRAYLPEELPRMVGKHRGILHVLPGITGLWQVSGRNQLPFAMRLDLDLRYVRNWSLALDVYLVACTVPTVLFGRGAS